MLPNHLLPNGALTAMRATANQFMTTPVTLSTQTITYSDYGEQTVSGTLIWNGLGYVGKLSGKDEELLKTAMYTTARDGIENTFPAIVLLPFSTPINETLIVNTQGHNWRVVWTNTDTQDSVQVYEKAIIVRTVERDGSDDV